MRYKQIAVSLLVIVILLSVAFLNIGGCGGSGGGVDDNGDGVAAGENIVFADITFAASLGGRFALDNLSFNPVLTFDEPEFSPPEPVNGKTVQGVTFLFTVDGIPSSDAMFLGEVNGIEPGPGDTPLITPPIIEGDDRGVLTLVFDPPVDSISFDFSLSDIVDIPNAATISIFDESDNLLGIASADATVPSSFFVFPEGTLEINTNGEEPPPVANVTIPILLTPINDEIIQQNNPNIGCPFDPTRGFGWRIFFDWTDTSSPNGIKGYHLFATNINAMFPIIDIFVPDSNFTETSCNSFVIDANLDGWIWTVQAEDNLGNLSSVETDEFVFEPCMLDDGTPCNAP